MVSLLNCTKEIRLRPNGGGKYFYLENIVNKSLVASQNFDALNPHRRSPLVATSLGNIFETFDLYIFGILAGTIAKLYFPSSNSTVSLLTFLSTFGVTFFVRPLGAVYLGNLGDKIGRTKAMSLSLYLMTIGMFIVGVTPTYDSVGILAPIVIVLGRVLQGFSAGGEFGSATALLAEHNPHRRGFITSWQAATQGFALSSAAATGAILVNSLSTDQFESWGWRVPFLFAAILGPIGMYIRKKVPESSEFREVQDGHPMVELFANHKRRVLVGAGSIVLATILIWMSVFMPTYAIRMFRMDPSIAYIGTVVTGAVVFILSPVAGWISDRVGRTPPMIVASIAIVFLAYPTFAMLQASPTLSTLVLVSGIYGTIIALYFGPQPALMSELFPPAMRTSGIALSYNLGITIFGGFAPLVLMGISAVTANPLAPSYYVILGAVISLVAVLSARTYLRRR